MAPAVRGVTADMYIVGARQVDVDAMAADTTGVTAVRPAHPEKAENERCYRENQPEQEDEQKEI
jgi:hypothetical protein